MQSRWKHRVLLVVCLTLSAVIVVVLTRSASTRESPTPRDRATAKSPLINGDHPLTAPRTPDLGDAGAALAAEVRHGVEDPALMRLRSALDSPNAQTRIDGIREAAEAGAYDALPLLLERRLDQDPESTVTVIRAVVTLAAQASPSERERAARQLQDWLAHEATSTAPGASGNTVALLKALAGIGSAEAHVTLRATLDAAQLPLAMQTLIVEQLKELREPRAAGEIERFLRRVAAWPAATAFDRELKTEAETSARDALASLGSPTEKQER